MARLALISDVHGEWWEEPILLAEAVRGADALLAPGDIHYGDRAVAFLAEIGLPVIYVPGNHEFYGHDRPRLRDRLRDEAARTSNVVLLDDGEASLRLGAEEWRVLGSTLWTRHDLLGEANVVRSRQIARRDCSDHRHIEEDGRPFSPEDAAALHEAARAFLANRLSGRDNSRTLVLTHFAPSEESLEPERRGTPESPLHASNLERLIVETQPRLWVHGHVHSPSDYEVYGTRVLCAPHGYPKPGRPLAPLFVDL